ncbi:hypothetical protein GGP42_001542 [Salinibacter ruber]|nr:hypothetical protein [Salinibacter ruber]
MDVPEDHPGRERAGVCSAHTCGPPGKRVKVILLDHTLSLSALRPSGGS